MQKHQSSANQAAYPSTGGTGHCFGFSPWGQNIQACFLGCSGVHWKVLLKHLCSKTSSVLGSLLIYKCPVWFSLGRVSQVGLEEHHRSCHLHFWMPVWCWIKWQWANLHTRGRVHVANAFVTKHSYLSAKLALAPPPPKIRSISKQNGKSLGSKRSMPWPVQHLPFSDPCSSTSTSQGCLHKLNGESRAGGPSTMPVQGHDRRGALPWRPGLKLMLMVRGVIAEYSEWWEEMFIVLLSGTPFQKMFPCDNCSTDAISPGRRSPLVEVNGVEYQESFPGFNLVTAC